MMIILMSLAWCMMPMEPSLAPLRAPPLWGHFVICNLMPAMAFLALTLQGMHQGYLGLFRKDHVPPHNLHSCHDQQKCHGMIQLEAIGSHSGLEAIIKCLAPSNRSTPYILDTHVVFLLACG